MPDFVAVIRSDALQTADRNGFTVHAPTATCRLTRPITSASQDARENVGFAVEEIGVRVSALRDQTNVFGDIRVGRARPLAIHYFVEVIRVANICRFHDAESFYTCLNDLW